MAILNTLRGTVESDPMRVPAPASMSTGRDDSFANALEDATASEPEAPAAEPDPVTDIDDEIAAMAAESEAITEEDVQDTTVREDADEGAAQMRGPQPGAPLERIQNNETLRRGEAGRQETAGKGTDSPRNSSAPAAAQPLIGEIIEHGARSSQLTVTVASGPAPASNAARSAGEPLLRAVDGTSQRGNQTARANAPTPGFRTSAKASAQMLDQARESVFKQILLKLTGDGGEMRMRLDPPQLGEIDLRMVIENGNRMSLSIGAERADLADMIQRHVDELSRSLADMGLELTHADVHARDASERGDLQNEETTGDDEVAVADNDIARPMSGGYIHADGLDFWV